MSRIIREEPGFNGVAAGSTATIDLPRTGTYDKLVLKYDTSVAGGGNEANMRAHILEVRTKVNGKVQRRLNGAEIIDLNAYRGKAFKTGQLPIYFAPPWSRTAQGEDVLAWGMADVASFQLEVELAAGATAPSLGLVSHKRNIEQNMGLITKVRKFNLPVTQTGPNVMSNLNAFDNYYALHCKTTDFSRVKAVVDGAERWNVEKEFLEDLYDDQGFLPQAGYTHLDWQSNRRTAEGMLVLNANVNGKVKRAQDVRLEFEMTAATGFDIIAEAVGPRD